MRTVPAKDPQTVPIKVSKAIQWAQSQTKGISIKPVVVSASFDYEMIQVKQIAGAAFDNAQYQRAYASLLAWLKPLQSEPAAAIVSMS